MNGAWGQQQGPLRGLWVGTMCVIRFPEGAVNGNRAGKNFLEEIMGPWIKTRILRVLSKMKNLPNMQKGSS